MLMVFFNQLITGGGHPVGFWVFLVRNSMFVLQKKTMAKSHFVLAQSPIFADQTTTPHV